MDERGQFTFYRSFWEAVKGLPKKDRLPILESIIEYALDGKAPSGLSQSQSAFFLLVKPNLDASRKKAASGKQGGSKPKAKGKQTQREKEVEKEKENEIENEEEIEKEYECNLLGGGGSSAGAQATETELTSVGLKPGEFTVVTSAQVARVRELGSALFRTYAMHLFCGPADYRHIFYRVTTKDSVSEDACGLLEYAFDAAHRAGKSGNWNYIEAVMDRCNLYGIRTAEEARRADCERDDNG